MDSLLHRFELPATDFDRAVRFYKHVFHVELKVEPLMADSSGQVMNIPRLQPAAQGSRIYLDGSSDIDNMLARVTAAGDRALLPAMSLPDGNGCIGLFGNSKSKVIGTHNEA